MRTEEYSDEIKDIKSELFQARNQLAEAQAAAAVMQVAAQDLIDYDPENQVPVCNCCSVELNQQGGGHKTDCLAKLCLATTAGTAFLARMVEAEWLVENAPHYLCFGVRRMDRSEAENNRANEWITRRDSHLKGEGAK